MVPCLVPLPTLRCPPLVEDALGVRAHHRLPIHPFHFGRLLLHPQICIAELRDQVAGLMEDNRVLADAAGWELCEGSDMVREGNGRERATCMETFDEGRSGAGIISQGRFRLFLFLTGRLCLKKPPPRPSQEMVESVSPNCFLSIPRVLCPLPTTSKRETPIKSKMRWPCLQGAEEDALVVPTGPSERIRVIEALSRRMQELAAQLDSALAREDDARWD